jgi:hypothetical protein
MREDRVAAVHRLAISHDEAAGSLVRRWLRTYINLRRDADRQSESCRQFTAIALQRLPSEEQSVRCPKCWLTIWISVWDREKLNALAAADGMNSCEVVRRVIESHLASKRACS